MPPASALLFTLAASVAVPITLARVVPIWAAPAVLAPLAIALFIPIRGRVLFIEWIAVVWGFLRNRRRGLVEELPDPVDLEVISGTAGIRWDGYTLVAVVEVAPYLALSDHGSEAVSGLPVALVAATMRQYGLVLDIDIVSSGRHLPEGSAGRTVYSQFAERRPVIGQRRTWLVLRLNAMSNLDGIVERGPSRIAAPKALAAAAHRVVQRLQQQQIGAHALSAEEIGQFADWLLKPVGAVPKREHWSKLRSGPNFITTYLGDPRSLAAGQIDRWWSWPAEDTVITLRLTAGTDDVQIGALVRYTTQDKAYRPPSDAKLSLRTGIQRQLLLAALPAGDRSLRAPIPTTSLSAVGDLVVPIGPSGQILGQLSGGTTVTAPLWDQSGNPHRRCIEAHVGLDLARQLVLGAVGAGAVVAVHTDARDRWDGLLAAVNDTDRLFVDTPGARECDIAVFDGPPKTAVPARTVLRLSEPSEPVGDADMTLVEKPGRKLEITVGDKPPVQLSVIGTWEDDL